MRLYVNHSHGAKTLLLFVTPISSRDTGINGGRRHILHHAAALGNLERVQQLCKANCDPDVASEDMSTPLIECAKHAPPLPSRSVPRHSANADTRHLEIAMLLIRRHADVEARDNDGRSALHHSAARGNQRMVEMFLRSGLRHDPRSMDDLTPAMEASRGRHLATRELLVQWRVPVLTVQEYLNNIGDQRAEDGLLSPEQKKFRGGME